MVMCATHSRLTCLFLPCLTGAKAAQQSGMPAHHDDRILKEQLGSHSDASMLLKLEKKVDQMTPDAELIHDGFTGAAPVHALPNKHGSMLKLKEL